LVYVLIYQLLINLRKCILQIQDSNQLDSKIKKKKIHKPIGSYKLSVEGMHCMNCAKGITDAVNQLDGLSCRVSLEKKEVYIQYEDKPKKIEVIKLLGDMDFLAREL